MNNAPLRLNGKTVYIAGIFGLTGSAIARELKLLKDIKVVGHSSGDVDFRNYSNTLDALRFYRPDVLIISAARVGGIVANQTYPVNFLQDNLLIQTNLIKSAFELEIPRVLFLGSSCVYPKYAEQPIKEEYLLTGPLEPTNQPYALAKIAGLELIKAYRTQHRLSWISAMPCNLYGPQDNFDDTTSHVIPALIKRYHDAKLQMKPEVEAWGTGTPLREFLHIQDFAQAIIFLLENYDEDSHVNIGSGIEISIKDLSNLIARVVGFEGNIVWNSAFPDGTPRKVLDISRITSLGWRPKLTLEYGIKSTYEWLVNEYDNLRI